MAKQYNGCRKGPVFHPLYCFAICWLFQKETSPFENWPAAKGRLRFILYRILGLGVFLSLSLAAEETPESPSPPPNLLQNGDFEQWSKDSGPPDGWVFLLGQSPEALQKDAAVRKSGNSSLRFSFVPPNRVAWPGQRVQPIHPDSEYRITGWMKVAPDSKLDLKLNIEPNLGGMTLPASEEWANWEFTFNTREATLILPQFRFRGEGTVWLDDIRLFQMGKPGDHVLPERVELLKLLEFQKHTVPPETNMDEWTRDFAGKEDARKAFTDAGPAGTTPPFDVGRWARYLCRDDLLVPSKDPEKRPHITLIDSAVVGKETVEGKTYYWFQSVVRQKRYWVSRSTGLYDSGEKILLEGDRKLVLSLLVDGPEFKDVRRYQVKVGDEPLLEFTDGEKAVLPRLNLDHLLIRSLLMDDQSEPPPVRPFVRLGDKRRLLEGTVSATVRSGVPITGFVGLEYRTPHLDRVAALVNWGKDAEDERRGEQPLVIKLARPPYLGIAFDGFGDLRHYQDMVEAGAELFQQLTVLYLGPARQAFNRMPAYFFDGRRWDVDPFDLCRSSFLGFSPHLDEPYQRQRKINEYVKRGESTTLAEAASKYSSAIASVMKTQAIWPGEEVMDYNSPTSTSWYSARVGAAGFVLENARLVGELETIARVTGKQDARALADEINIACLRGAARKFGGWWGQGLYRWTPDRYWFPELTYYAERGAQYLGFWIELTPASAGQPLAFYEQVRAALPQVAKTIKSIKPKTADVTTVIVVPNGYVLGWAGSDPVTPWGILDFPEGNTITDGVISAAAKLFDQGATFDIVVDDPEHPPDLRLCRDVIRIGQ